MRRQLNRYTQRELDAIIEALGYRINGYDDEADKIDIPATQSALAKSRLRLRKEEDRAK